MKKAIILATFLFGCFGYSFAEEYVESRVFKSFDLIKEKHKKTRTSSLNYAAATSNVTGNPTLKVGGIFRFFDSITTTQGIEYDNGIFTILQGGVYRVIFGSTTNNGSSSMFLFRRSGRSDDRSSDEELIVQTATGNQSMATIETIQTFHPNEQIFLRFGGFNQNKTVEIVLSATNKGDTTLFMNIQQLE